jgi:signal peptidase II
MRLAALLGTLTILLDQLTKWLVVEKLMRPDGVTETPFYVLYSVTITPFFSLVMAWNRGVSFGMFNNLDSRYNAWVLTAVSLVICAGLVAWMVRCADPLLRAGLALIVGGALGNVIDRVRFGAVADFLDVHVAGYHWPAFNLADSAITLGAALLLADALFRQPKKSKDAP